jgi:hypothetical protein
MRKLSNQAAERPHKGKTGMMSGAAPIRDLAFRIGCAVAWTAMPCFAVLPTWAQGILSTVKQARSPIAHLISVLIGMTSAVKPGPIRNRAMS